MGLYEDRKYYQAKMATNQDIMDTLDTNQPSLYNLYNKLAGDNQSYRGEISRIDAALDAQETSEHDRYRRHLGNCSRGIHDDCSDGNSGDYGRFGSSRANQKSRFER